MKDVDTNKVNLDAVKELEERIKGVVNSAKSTKIEVDFDIDTLNRIQEIFELLEDETKSQTVKKCIDITSFILAHHLAGSRVLIEEPLEEGKEPVYHVIQFPEFEKLTGNKIITEEDK